MTTREVASSIKLKLKENYNEIYITDNLIEKLKNKEEKEMLAILDAIDEENERILQQGIQKGKREGIREGIRKTKINNAQKMKKANLDIKLIMEITGLSKKETVILHSM